MIKIENTEIVGWQAAIRGMRNPLESWDKSDSDYCNPLTKCYCDCEKHECAVQDHFNLGPNDLGLMKRLCKAGTDHRKFMRMLVVYVDITAPLYWWKEFDTYRAGVKYLDDPNPFDIEMNSCSTMHCIHKKEFTLDDFSWEHLTTRETDRVREDGSVQHNSPAYKMLEKLIDILNIARENYLMTNNKNYWWQMIQLLPTSYNQKRTVMLNYEVLANMYKSRKDHKLSEWVSLCSWIESLPYSQLIIGENYGTMD